MKIKLLFFVFFCISQSFAQSKKLQKILDSGNLQQLKSYYTKNHSLDEFLLIEKKLDDEPSIIEMHPLVYVSFKGNIAFIRYYLEVMPEDLTVKDLFSELVSEAFIASLSGKDDEISTLLFSYDVNKYAVCSACKNHTAIMVAAAYGNEKWYFKLRELDFPDGISTKGNNILHCAVSGGSVKIVTDILAQKRIDINATNQDYFKATPLDYSVSLESDSIFNLLINEGADCNTSGYIWFATAETTNPNIWNYLINHANTNDLQKIDDYYETPLHYAMYFDNTMVALWMMEKLKEIYCGSNVYQSESFDGSYNHPLWYPIILKNKELFEAYVAFSTHINAYHQDYTLFPIYTRFKKSASKTFGKDFVTTVYNKYNVVEIK